MRDITTIAIELNAMRRAYEQACKVLARYEVVYYIGNPHDEQQRIELINGRDILAVQLESLHNEFYAAFTVAKD